MYLLEPHWELVKEYMGIYQFNKKFIYDIKNLCDLFKEIIFKKQSDFYDYVIYGYEYGYLDSNYIDFIEKTHTYFKKKYIPIWCMPLYLSDKEYLDLLKKLFWEILFCNKNKKYYLKMYLLYCCEETNLNKIN